MEFRLLGPIEAVRDVRSLPLGGAKPRALLALLLLHANEVVSRDRLIEALWPGRPPGSAEHSLDVQVSRLRKAFAPDELLLTRSGGYVLEVEPDAIDSARFERLLDEGRRANAAGEPAGALRSLEPALALWRGQALAEVAYEDFARVDAETARGAPARRDRGADRRRARARPARHARRRARGPDREAPPARAAPRAAHARALPRRAARGGVARVLGGAEAAGARSSGSSPARRSASSSRRSCARIRRSTSRAPGRRAAAAGRSWALARSCWQPPPWRSSWA